MPLMNRLFSRLNAVLPLRHILGRSICINKSQDVAYVWVSLASLSPCVAAYCLLLALPIAVCAGNTVCKL
eukprot:c39475_g1_i1 orf=3-209(-)